MHSKITILPFTNDYSGDNSYSLIVILTLLFNFLNGCQTLIDISPAVLNSLYSVYVSEKYDVLGLISLSSYLGPPVQNIFKHTKKVLLIEVLSES